MSFLAGRLAATEGAFFTQHSKQVAAALKHKLGSLKTIDSTNSSPTNPSVSDTLQADVLPEVLRHSTPLAPNRPPSLSSATETAPAPSSLAAALQLTLGSRKAVKNAEIRNGFGGNGPVAHLPSIPQTTLGRRKWNIEAPEVRVAASTANDARVGVENSENVKAMMEGLFDVTKAFLVASGLVFGGGVIGVSIVSARLELRSAQRKAEQWKLDESQRRSIGAEFAESLGVHRKWKSN